MHRIFRDVAVRHAATGRRYGEIVLARPLSHTLLVLLFAVIACAIAAFFACFTVTRKAHVRGLLLPSEGLLRIVTPQAGLITSKTAQEGLEVKAGDVLFVVTDKRTTVDGGDAQMTITRLLRTRRDSASTEGEQQQRQSLQRLAAAEHRVGSLQTESVRLESLIALQKKRVVLAAEALRRQEDLRRSGFVSQATVQEREAELIDQQQRAGELDRAKASNARELANARAEVSDMELQALRERQVSARNIAALEQELAEAEAHREVAIKAPHSGSVSAISGSLGQPISAGQPLATFVPSGALLEAELYAPSRSIGFVKPGMPVLLRYHSFPHQKFGQFRGEVREISAAAMQHTELPHPELAAPGGIPEPTYRIRVRLDSQVVRANGRDQPLKPGMTVDASILLESRRLYEWALEPLFSISGRL